MPRTSNLKVVVDGVERAMVSPALAAAIGRLRDLLTDAWGWDRAYEYRGRGALVANLVPFAYRHDPIALPDGVVPRKPRLPNDPPGTPPAEPGVAGVEVSPELAAAVTECDGRMIAEFGGNMSWVVMAEGGLVGASNRRDGFVPPRVRPPPALSCAARRYRVQVGYRVQSRFFGSGEPDG